MTRAEPFPDSRRVTTRRGLFLAVLFSGVAGLSWEMLWQHHTSLAIGVSSHGTAITLAAMMTGLGLGAFLAAQLSRRGKLRRPMMAFGICELIVGSSALLVGPGFLLLGLVDGWAYGRLPWVAPWLQLSGSILVLLLPSTAMGATIPILAPMAKVFRTNIAHIYAMNLLGAVSGVLAATFVSLPLVGVFRSSLLIAVVNLSVALWALSRRMEEVVDREEETRSWPPAGDLWLAFASGTAIFALEVSWFRSLRAALQATTESFALILAGFLLALAAGGWLAPRLRARGSIRLGGVMVVTAVAVFLTTPAVDSFDRLLVARGTVEHFSASLWIARSAEKLGWIVILLAVPGTLLGVVFPWLMAEHDSTGGTGRLYVVNTFGAVSGALIAGFLLLPTIGATWTSWAAALLVLVAPLIRRPSLRLAGVVGCVGLFAVFVARSWTGSPAEKRVKGRGMEAYGEILFVDEGPDSTVWIARHDEDDSLALIIDGFAASAEVRQANYMTWMGHLPALATPKLDNALVICFGTGQTVHAVRQHRPSTLHVVDVNEGVFLGADFFPANEGVLDDPIVRATVMDGRAYLRRVDEIYDLVTLEPMPPNFAGSNNLYSSEFYRLIERRLAPAGMVAQWVPFHLLGLRDMVAILASFLDVFPYSRLWIDPESSTGVLVGSRKPWQLRATEVDLSMDIEEVGSNFLLGPEALAEVVRDRSRVTDDNQLLAYGYERLQHADDDTMGRANLSLLRWYAGEFPSAFRATEEPEPSTDSP